MRRRLVLASASPARLRQLRDAGMQPEVVVSGVDESHVTGDTAYVVQALADAKADAVASRVGDALVLGCDSLLLFAGEGLGKPVDEAEVVRRWQAMAGHSGELLTGHCLLDVRDDRIVGRAGFVARTVVHFGRPTDEELAAYVASGEPVRVAG